MLQDESEFGWEHKRGTGGPQTPSDDKDGTGHPGEPSSDVLDAGLDNEGVADEER